MIELSPRKEADEAWLQMYLRRGDVKSSMLDDIFKLVRVGLPESFRNTKSMFNFIDKLPGVAFRMDHITIDGSPPFPFAWRSLLAVIVELASFHNGKFLDPDEAETVMNPTDFIHGERFRRLNAHLRSLQADAILMPIVLNSGVNL